MRFRFTLKKALSLNFILAAIVPLAVTGFIALHLFSRTIEQEISTGHIQLARALAGEVGRFLAEPVRVLELVNNRAAYRRKIGETPSPDEFLTLVGRSFPVFERIELVDERGVIRSVAPPNPERTGTVLSGQPFFENARATRHPVFSETLVSSATGRPTIAVVIPGKESFAVGYLNLAALDGIIDKIVVREGAYAAISDRFGRVIAHPDKRLVDERSSIKNIEPIRRALTGQTGTFRYSLQDQKKIGSTALINATGWIVLVCQPEKEAFAAVTEIRNLLLAAVFTIAVLALLWAVFVLRKPLRSILALVGAAQQASRGDYRFEGAPSSYPEIDTLADSLTGMVEEVANRENSLRKTEEKYRSLVDESFDGLFLHDGDVILFVNRRFCEMLGYKEKELIGREFTSLLDQQCRGIAVERTHLRFEGKPAPRRYDVKMIKGDGALLDVEVSAGAVMVDNKQAIQVWVRDISEQKRLEEERALSERRFGELYNSVSDLIYTQDMEGRFTSANRAIARLFDLTPSEMVGLKASAFMKPELAPLYDTEYLGKLKEQGHYEGVTAYIAGDNHKFYIEYRSALVRPPHGEPFITGIGREVTDQIMARRKEREAAQRMEAVLNASPNPIVAYDVQGNVIFINKQFTNVFGWSLEELAGRPVPFVPEDQKEKTIRAVTDLYSGKFSGVGTMETARLTKAGDRRDVIANAILIPSPGGKPAGMVVSLTDITERKKMEAAFSQSQKMEAVGILAGGIAHDFNNLLMGIRGNASLSLLKGDMNGALRKNMENIEALVNRGATLTRQLLGFARGGKYEVKTCDIWDILEVESELFGDTRKDIVIERNPRPDLWKVDVDRPQMEQVFMNLFVNAGQAMLEGGNLFLGAENVVIDDASMRGFDVRPGRYVKISVTDTGIGMDEKTKNRIFEPFFTTKEPGKGTGMGLASVYGIIKNHAGFISVYSEVGNGSSFHIYLPASESETVEKRALPKTEEELVRGRGTILLVDDEPMIMDVAREMLESFGYTVITASSGREAIEKFSAVQSGTGEAARIDLVIQDMIMPGVGGGEVFDRLKELDPDVKVLLSSGYSINGHAKDILSKGCSGFIQKPYTMGELNRKVREVLK